MFPCWVSLAFLQTKIKWHILSIFQSTTYKWTKVLLQFSVYPEWQENIQLYTKSVKTSKYANFDKPRNKLSPATTWSKVNPIVWVNYSHKKYGFFILVFWAEYVWEYFRLCCGPCLSKKVIDYHPVERCLLPSKRSLWLQRGWLTEKVTSIPNLYFIFCENCKLVAESALPGAPGDCWGWTLCNKCHRLLKPLLALFLKQIYNITFIQFIDSLETFGKGHCLVPHIEAIQMSHIWIEVLVQILFNRPDVAGAVL